MKNPVLVLIAGLALLSAPNLAPAADTTPKASATAVDVSGTWDAIVETQQGTGSPVFTLKQDGQKLSGKYQGQFGEAAVSGSITGNTVTFGVTVKADEELTIEYKGTVDGNAMKGTARFGSYGEGTFTAKKRAK